MAHRSQCSSAGDNPLDPNYLPPHYREEYRLAIDSLVEEDLEGYYHFLQRADVVDFLCSQEIEFIQNAVQAPREANDGDQQRCPPGSGGDSSSDTYWPVHSDLDAPDLDLGWPQLNRFVGPTEVTTLVNPPEPDMPSIKEQARRMIRSSQQVVAIVMDMFTDVDIFAEILDAAMRNVAVYILLDELNAHHFVNMLSNCRVNLDCIKSLRVRTVSGISYQCRSGKLLKGQVMSRFLLTDSRAVLSGNYSFMWSFEKLHRCFAHLFLGQLVSNFDEEFRILYAQSQPMTMDNLPAPKESFVPLPERQYLTDRSVRESRKNATVDNPGPDERSRHNFDERGDKDWKNMPHNRHEDMYMNPSQQLRMGQPSNLMEGHNYKRHSYAEGKQTSYQPMQQPGMPRVEGQGRRTDAVYSAYDKFKNHAYPQVDQHPEPGLPHEMEQPESYDLVLNYLSSTSDVEMDKMSDNFNPAAELSTGSSRPKRLSLGKPQGREPSPSPPNQPEQGSNVDRKDPTVRQGLRNWRIKSYLSTCDNAGEEDMPLPTHQASDPFDETPNPSYDTVSGPDLFTAKPPNTLEFKVPHRPYPSYRKSNLTEHYPEDFLTLPAQAKLTPSTSESSLTEADKTDEMDEQEPKEESFRRRFNPAVPRSSRLRSSLLFGSQLDQPGSQDIRTTTGRQDEDTDKVEGSESRLPFALQVLGHRKTFVKEPFDWSRLAKSATFDSSLTDASNSDDVRDKEGIENTSGTQPLKDNHKNTDLVTASTPMDALMRPSSSHCELSKIDQPRQLSDSLMEIPFVDMSDADHRLMFFKQLAAKRKAEKVSESANANTDKVVLKTQMDPKTATVKIEQPTQKKPQRDPVVEASCEKEQSNVSTDSEKLELKKTQTQTQDPSLSVKSESSLMESSIRDPSCVEQPASSKSSSIPDSSESSVAHNPVGVDSSLSLSVPLVSSSSEQIQSDVDPSKRVTIYPTRPIIVREPFKWNRNVRSAIFDTTIKKRDTVDTTENSSGVEHPENSVGKAASKAADVELAIPQCVLRPSSSHCELSKIDQLVQPQPLPGESTVDMTDADNRLMFFKELAAKRKVEKAEGTNDPAAVSLATHSNSKIDMLHNEEPAAQKLDAEGTGHSKEGETKLHKTALEKYFTKDIAQLTPTVSTTVEDDNGPVPMAGCESERGSVTTDSEKIELKKIKRQASTSTPDQSPSTISSQSLEVPPAPTPTETSTAANSRTSQNTPTDPTPSLSQPLSTMAPSTTLESNSTDNKSVDTREPAEAACPPSLDSPTTGSETPEDDATKSSPAKTESSSDVEPMKPESTSFPTEIPETLSEDVESDAPSEACESDSKPTSIQTPSETLPEEPCAPSSEDELPPTESNSVALESSSPTAARPSQEDVEDITNASLSISLPQPCSADPTESSESSIYNVEKEPVDSPKSNAADEIKIEETVLPSSTLAPDSGGSVPPIPTLSEESPIALVLQTLSENQTKPALEVILTQTPDQTKLTGADETTIELKPTASESCPSEPIVAMEKSMVSDPCEVEKESTTTEEPVPVSPLSKQPKASQSRYHSSTASVISSSNLRDDTKLLLGQISANSQNRNEPTKEQPVTDDDKESEADKKAKGQKDGGSKYKVRGSTKTAEEREVLLQKIQSMRKERKVYSRFETPK
ncbi:protein FAM83H-like [Gadus macrocephalus]|uniref:protein FAM83H-like n=1 Tax=Gadus macrocephalus TaxID=80720 RepID=UPI0028CB1C8B|nr:protein FAM83H-like [Gadus macrocephalus]